MARRLIDEYGNEYDDPEDRGDDLANDRRGSPMPDIVGPQSPDDRRLAIEAELNAQYRKTLGRDMDAGERRSEYENYEKYGGESIRRNLRERKTNAPGENGDRIDDRPSSSTTAYQQYLSGGSPAIAGQPVSTAQPVQDPLLARLIAQLEGDRTRQDTERADMRRIVMSQLGEATAPVDPNAPGIKPLIDAQKLALQRGAQRQRSAAVERAGVRGLGDSGALDTRINQIEQGRGEEEGAAIARIMNNELGAKRQQVMHLLDMAVRSGDAEAARTLQGQLTMLDQQMTQGRFSADLGFRNRTFDADLGFRNRTFDADLGFRRYAFDRGEDSTRYRFDNDLAARLAQMQLQGNLGAMGFLEGLL